MRKTQRFSTLIVLVLLGCAFECQSDSRAEEPPARTKADTNREVIQTYAQFYLDQGNPEQAERVLTEYLTQDGKTDTGAGILWSLLGSSQIEQKKYAQACYSYKHSSELYQVSEDRATALYRYADCLNRGGSAKWAKDVLEQISEDEEVGESIREVIELFHGGTIRPGDVLPQLRHQAKSKLHVMGAVGAGYDTNVLLVEESAASGTPASQMASPFLSPAVQLGYNWHALHTDIDSRYIASFTDYTAQAAKSYNSLYQRADFIFGSTANRLGLFGETLFMNRSPFQLYLWDAGLAWYHTISYSDKDLLTLEVPVHYQYYPLDVVAGAGAYNNRQGEDVQVKVTSRKGLSATSYFLSQLVFDLQYTKGQDYRLFGLTLPVTYAFSLPFFEKFGIMNSAKAELSSQYYWVSSSQRRDFSGKLGTGFIKKIADGYNASLDFLLQKSISSYQAARYSKGLISLLVSHDFQ